MESKEFGTVKLFQCTEGKTKWTYNEKKIIIDNRIKYDHLYERSGYNRAKTQDIWRFIIKVSNLEHLEVQFVQNQWHSFIAKYRSIVNRYLSHDGTFPEERVEELSKNWEFFRTIHNFMNNKKKPIERSLREKTNNSPLADHGYGKRLTEEHSNISINSRVLFKQLKPENVQKATKAKGSQQKYNIQVRKLSDLRALDGNVELPNVKLPLTDSSISGPEKWTPLAPKILNPNKSTIVNKIVTPIAISTSEPSFLPTGGMEGIPQSEEIYPISIESSTATLFNQETEKIYNDIDNNDNISQTVSSLPSKSLPTQPSITLLTSKASSSTKSADDRTTKKRKHSKIRKHHDCNKHYRRTYEEKLYKHTKRTTRRIERRMDAFLNVFAQIVKEKHPNVNVNKILKKKTSSSYVTNTSSTDSSD